MTNDERKVAIKAIKEANADIYGGEIRKYRTRQIITGVLAGAGLVGYIAQKATEPIVNIEALPITGYAEESYLWVKNVLLPKLRSFPSLWEALKGTNDLEHFTAAVSALLAGASLWHGHKRKAAKRERDKKTLEEMKGLGR